MPFLLACFLVVNLAVGQQELPLFPKYQVLGVIYAPPGQTSFVDYNLSTQVGSSHSMVSDSSTTTTQTQSSTSGFSLFGFGYSDTQTTSDAWTSAYENTSSESLQTTTNNGINVTGPYSGLGVLHDADIIVVWLNPVYKSTLMPPVTVNGVTTYPIQWSGLMFNGCDLNATGQYPVNFVQLIDGCDPNGFPGPDIVYLTVGCLKNPYYKASVNDCSHNLAQTARSWDLDPWGPDGVTKAPLGPGLTIQDYADILQADPFVTQTLVEKNGAYTNPCHPEYGINFDPNTGESIPDSATFTAPYVGKWPTHYCGTPNTQMDRFTFNTSSIPYPPSFNGQAVTKTGSLSNTATSTQGEQWTDTHTHSFNESTSLTFAATATYGFPTQEWGSIGVSALSAGFNFGTTSGTGTSWTDGQTIGYTATKSETDSAGWSITGPGPKDTWVGPNYYDAYQDNIYGTFAFRDPNRPVNTEIITPGKTSPIGISFSKSTNFGTVTVGKKSAANTVTLTNNSPNVMTMLSPVLSFSDATLVETSPGVFAFESSFKIVSDACSIKVLQPAKTCTLTIDFAPTINAAPNTEQANYPVTAYVIAAGNEAVPVNDSGTPTYYEQTLVTNTVITVSGSTETAVTVSGTAVPAAATCTGIYPSCNIGATLTPATLNFAYNAKTGTQVYTFKNYASVSQAVSSIALSDTTDYSITSDNCSGHTWPSLATCTFTLVYSAKGTGMLNTQVSVLQNVNGVNTTLAFAGAAAFVTNGVSAPAVQFGVAIVYPQTGGSGSGTLTVTNTSNTYNLSSLGISLGNETGQGGGWELFLGSCAGATLTPGASCSATITFTTGLCSGGAQSCYAYATATVTGTEDKAVSTQAPVTCFVDEV